ncbi:MAG: metallophosphatase domain-containing protein [Acidobacteriota bacterium]|nr:metallophosphatase domain-containing protein [Acidobacteriota bacterium]
MPRIVCLSDTHNYNEQISVPDGDILIHAGDATIQGSASEIILFNRWFRNLPHAHKIFVAGNHDWLFETSNQLARTLLDSSIHYLQDSSVRIENLKIYGSPWQPRFFDWAFNLTRGAELAEKWKLIPDDTDILITHGPPFGILDEVQRQYFIENTGCEELNKRVETIKPKFHIFGHIHCGYGTTEKFGVKFVNASNCDESYEPTNTPVVIDL